MKKRILALVASVVLVMSLVACGTVTLESYYGNALAKKLLDAQMEQQLEEAGIKADHIEGRATGWVLLEYKGVVVHIFLEESRNYYNLERLWEDASKIDEIFNSAITTSDTNVSVNEITVKKQLYDVIENNDGKTDNR